VTAAASDLVHGLRAAAKLAGRSPSGIQKLVDAGRVPAERNGRTYIFRASDLESIGRSRTPSEAPGFPASGASRGTPPAALSMDAPVLSPGHDEVVPMDEPTATSGGAPIDEGAVASAVFADLQAGHDLRQIVVERRLRPEIVRRAYDEWVALANVDVLRAPEAAARLATAEGALALLTAQLPGIESALQAAAVDSARIRQNIEGRLRGLDQRLNAATVTAGGGSLARRVETLELRVAALPAAPLPIGQQCPGCGAHLVVAASCSGCGVGRMNG
jgi:hypothetical protein